MHAISHAVDDVQCLNHLKIRTEFGAQMLVHVREAKSSLPFGCERGFQNSLALMLTRWNPDLDHTEDQSAPEVL